MKAVILAAGMGTRLKPITNEVPKGLVQVHNKPILEYILDSVQNIVDEIIIIIGYKGEQVIEYFQNEFNGVPIKYVKQEEQLGTGHALLCAKEYLEDKFIVLNGDDIYSPDEFEELSNYDYAILSKEVEDPSRFGVVVGDEYLENVVEKPQEFISNKIVTGVYLFTTKIFDHDLKKSPRGELEITDYLTYIINETNSKIKIVKVKKYWIPVNNHDQLRAAESFFQTQ